LSAPTERRIRVLVVDDSAVVRRVLTTQLSLQPGLEVVGVAPHASVAWTKIEELRPDVVTLDVEMPDMDGVSFLRVLMRERPTPVVMVSSLTQRGAEVTLDALAAGAVDFVAKPAAGVDRKLADLVPELAEKIRAASRSRVQKREEAPRPVRATSSLALAKTTYRVLAIGASTGGTEAIREVLERLPADAPGVVIVQHMPEHFTASFARRCDQACAVRVKEAADDDRVIPGHVLIAPGNHHMRLVRRGGNYHVQVTQEEAVNRHRPSVDVLFDSVAKHAGANAVGVILTGMGADGAKGLLEMRLAGAHTIAQDEATCVVFGMPREAILNGGAEVVLPLPAIADRALRFISEDS
jgi:two-component system chemotaxis response regulator CheB